MFNAFDDPLFGFDAVCVSVAAGHGYGRFDDVAVVCGREKFGDFYFHLLAFFHQPLSFHFKFFFSHKYAFFLYEYAA